jgi:O-antigen ligase
MIERKEMLMQQRLYIVLILTLPFYTLNFPIINLAFKDILLIIICLAYFFKMAKGSLSICKSNFTLLIIIYVFILFSILSLKNTPDVFNSIRVIISIFNILAFVFVTLVTVKNTSILIIILRVLYVCSVVLSVLGILQVIFYQFLNVNLGGALGYPFILPTNIRATGLFNNPNLFSFFLYLGHSISLISLLFRKFFKVINIKFKYILFNHLIIIGAIISSGSKGAFISILMCTLISFTILVIRAKAWPLLIAPLIFTVSYALFNITSILKMIFEDSGEENARVGYWGYALKMFSEKPLLGYGMNSFREVNHINHIPHNLYLQTLSENGLLGLLLILIILIMSAWKSFKIIINTSDYKLLVIALILFTALGQMMLHSFSLSSLNNVMLWLSISLISALNSIYKHGSRYKNG